MSILLGVILAVGTWITMTTMLPYLTGEQQGVSGGIVQNHGQRDPILFLEITLTENWLIFITRANGPFWSSIPSWQLAGAIFVVDILATCFTIFGWFVGGRTNIVAVVRVWAFSFGIFCIMAGVYYVLQGSQRFDSLMHGKLLKRKQKQRSLEDFGTYNSDYATWKLLIGVVVSLQRVSTQHEKTT